MSTETSLPIVISAKEYGLSDAKASEIANAFIPVIQEMEELESELAEVNTMEQSKDKSKRAKALRLRYVKVRTKSAEIHKEEKDYFRKGGLYVDAWKNAHLKISEKIESGLKDIELYEQRLEEARLEKLKQLRLEKLDLYRLPEQGEWPASVFEADDESFELLLGGIKLKYETRMREIEALKEIEKQKQLQEELRLRRRSMIAPFDFWNDRKELELTSLSEETFNELLIELQTKKKDWGKEQERLKEAQALFEAERKKNEEAQAKLKDLEKEVELEKAKNLVVNAENVTAFTPPVKPDNDKDRMKMLFENLYIVIDKFHFESKEVNRSKEGLVQLLQSTALLINKKHFSK